MKLPPKSKHWQLDFKLPSCPVCSKRELLLDVIKVTPFFEWRCRSCDHKVEYG